MKTKNYFSMALVAIVCSAIMVACGDKNKPADEKGGNNNQQQNGTEQTDGELNKNVCAATFPTNVKITTRRTSTIPGFEVIENYSIVKLGNEWMVDLLVGDTEEEWLLYCKFATDGKTTKVMKSTNKGASWTDDSSTYTDFKDFINKTGNKELFLFAMTSDVTGQPIYKYEDLVNLDATETICGITCNKYKATAGQFIYCVTSDRVQLKQLYYSDAECTNLKETYLVTNWDTTVKNFDFTKP